MQLKELFDLDLINDTTEIWVRHPDSYVLAHGKWYQDSVLEYLDCELESFMWKDNNNIYVDLKESDEVN